MRVVVAIELFAVRPDGREFARRQDSRHHTNPAVFIHLALQRKTRRIPGASFRSFKHQSGQPIERPERRIWNYSELFGKTEYQSHDFVSTSYRSKRRVHFTAAIGYLDYVFGEQSLQSGDIIRLKKEQELLQCSPSHLSRLRVQLDPPLIVVAHRTAGAMKRDLDVRLPDSQRRRSLLGRV